MSTKMRSVLSVLLCLSGVALCEQLLVNQRCQEHCTETYPEHTYPHPDDHSACARGCRLAEIEALLSWPLPADNSMCVNECNEAYAEGSQRYACNVGCLSPTIDTIMPDRGDLYPECSNSSSEDSLWSLLTSGPDLDTLSLHADLLSQHAPVHTIQTFISQDESNRVIMVVVEEGWNLGGSLEEVQQQAVYNDYYEDPVSTRVIFCPWRSARLFLFGGALIIATTLLLCCCLQTKTKGPLSTEKTKRSVAVECEEQKVPLLSKPIGLPVHLQLKGKEVEGFITVV